MKFFNSIFFFLFIGIFLSSCTSEPKPTEPDMSLLNGKWELQEAFTNNKPTQRLDGAYFEFKEDGTMATNVLGQEEKGTYVLEKMKLTQTTSRSVDYVIETIEPKNLVMQMDLASRKFTLKLTKPSE